MNVATPLILVVGDDRLTGHVVAELTATAGHDVRVMGALDADTDAALNDAGVAHATSILTLCADDRLNLSIALRARLLNPTIRLVLRQHDTVLGRTLEQNLADCTVLSTSAHAAATYAGAALDPSCLFAIRFPAEEGPLVGFAGGLAADLGIGDVTVAEAERRLRLRIVALDDCEDPSADATIAADARVTTFGPIRELRRAAPLPENIARPAERPPAAGTAINGFARINPIVRILAASALTFFLLSFLFFHFALGKTWTAAAFYVVETMTNVGFGEVDVVTRRGPLITGAAIVAMLGGIIFTSVFIGYVSSAVTRAQWTAMQGLRRIRARDHVIICGAGKVGVAVMNLLTAAGRRVVIVEPNPSPALVRRAREPDVDVLTGDARGDGALDLCDIANATSLLALTDDDAANLEIALGARARAPHLPLVVRMEDPGFAHAAAQLLGIATFSPSALSAPALAGLSRFPGTRGRVRYGDDDHTVGQRVQGDIPERPPARACTALCVWRDDALLLIRTFDEMRPFDIVLFSVPLAQFRPAAVAD